MKLPGLFDEHEQNLIPIDGVVEYFSTFFNIDYTKQLIDDIEWKQDEIQMFGKVHPLPRLTAWYGDPDIIYSYSGIKNIPKIWTPLLEKIKMVVEQQTKTPFNSVLINYYRDGNDHMSWHSDDEKELGSRPLIASVSFGEKRRFQFKHKFNKDVKVVTIEPDSGSLLLMKNETQFFWNHRLAKTTKSIGPRVNLTFRKISK